MIVAVLDACVLYPPSLRDLLLRVSVIGGYSPRWTDAIQSEWIRNVLENSPKVSESRLIQTRSQMELFNPNANVRGYEGYIPTLSLPDINDCHVLAAAIHSSASHIVTYNLWDFPISSLGFYDIEAIHPDLFLSALYDDDPSMFLHAVRNHRQSLRNAPKSTQDYIETLNVNRLHEVASRVSEHLDEI